MKNHIPVTPKRTVRLHSVRPVTAIALLAACHSASAANLVQNGSFEDPVVTGFGGQYDLYTTGQSIGGAWLVEHADTYTDILRGLVYALSPTPAGDQYCYLADNVSYAVLRQDLAAPLQGGVTYELSFLQSGTLGFSGGKVTVELSPTGGSAELTHTFSLPQFPTDWTQQSLLFTPAQTGPYTLRLSSTQSYDASLDDVRLVAVPEPAEFGLVAALGLTAAAYWQRRHRFVSGTH